MHERGPTYDKERIRPNIARIRKGGRLFEINIDPDLAVAFKEGKEVDVKSILKAEHIFEDVTQGVFASDNKLVELFGTDKVAEIAKIILREGEIQLTIEQRDKIRENKLKQIKSMILRNAIDPRTNLPLPAERINLAFEEAKIKVDEFKTADFQLQDVIKKLRPVLPLKFEVKEFELVVKNKHVPQAQGVVRQLGRVLHEEWSNEGDWKVVVEIPGGVEAEFFDRINTLTHGSVMSKQVK